MKAETQNKVVMLENIMKEMPQIEIETLHHFAPGVYLRTIKIPAGCLITGRVHRTLHMNILAQGTIEVTTDEAVETLTGVAVFNSEKGTKKAIYAHTDAIFMNVLPTELTDVDEIERVFTAPSYEALAQDERKALRQENKG